MAKPEWGAKHQCSSCNKAFYDMRRDPITCPSCGKEHVPEKLLKPAKAVAKEAEKPKAAPVKPVANDDDDEDKIKLLLDDDEILAEEDVDLDDDDDDDSDLGVVVTSKNDDDL